MNQQDFSTPVSCAELCKPEVFERLYDHFSPKLYRYSFLRLSSPEDAEDVLSAVFLKFWEYVARQEKEYRAGKSSGTITHVPAFLYRITRNLIIDRYRVKTRPLSLELLSEAGFEAPDKSGLTAILKAEHALVLSAFDALLSDERDLLVLRYVEGVPVKEIAEMYEITENNASVRLHRALQRLKTIIHQDSRIEN